VDFGEMEKFPLGHICLVTTPGDRVHSSRAAETGCSSCRQDGRMGVLGEIATNLYQIPPTCLRGHFLDMLEEKIKKSAKLGRAHTPSFWLSPPALWLPAVLQGHPVTDTVLHTVTNLRMSVCSGFELDSYDSPVMIRNSEKSKQLDSIKMRIEIMINTIKIINGEKTI
jgi:hypothetical protein